jgi:hypothetical protein
MGCQHHKPGDDRVAMSGEGHEYLSHLVPYSRCRPTKYNETVLGYDIMRRAYTQTDGTLGGV